MSKDLGMEASPRITVRDAYSREELVRSKELGASDDWHKEILHFVTGPSTRLIEIRLDRPPSSRELTGKLWFDEFVMQ